MKTISLFLTMLMAAGSLAVRAQDAATEERLNKLSGSIADLRESQDALKKQIERLAKEIEMLREQTSKPTGNYASADDLKSLVKSIEEVDRKRMKDFDTVDSTLKKLKAELLKPAPGSKKSAVSSNGDAGAEKTQADKTTVDKGTADKTSSDKPAGDDKAYPYVIKKGDTLEALVLAYKEKNIKITVDQILKANPGLKPEKMYIGQKIWIPAPQS
jgi:LysM repeat protein